MPAIDISPLEGFEQILYRLFEIISISILVCSIFFMFHMFTPAFLITGSIGIIGTVFFPWIKKKRFGNMMTNLGPRVAKLEKAMGVDV